MFFNGGYLCSSINFYVILGLAYCGLLEFKLRLSCMDLF